MTEDEWEKLREHLEVVRPTIEVFRQEIGFVYPEASSVGRYPRIRIESQEAVNRWFDLWMDLDSQGQKYVTFVPERPYTLSAGASVVRMEGGERVRYQKLFICFESVPFSDVIGLLDASLRENYERLMSLSSQTLLAEGKRVRLSG